MAEIKISDLSIGDWVAYNGKKYRIKEISSPYASVTLWGNNEQRDESIVLIEPIPLTPEILEKNGFEEGKRYDGLDVRVFSNDNISVSMPQYAKWNRVRVYDDEGLYELSSAIIYYVHQLQHALRLAGVEKEIDV